MIYYHDFLIDVSAYAALGQANAFPELACCPICRARNRLQRHGFYERNAIEEEQEHRIFICRLCCPDCGRTVSILPTFLLPYFQYTWEAILRILLAVWTTCRLLGSRQLRRFYERRVQAKQTELALFIQQEAMTQGGLPLLRKTSSSSCSASKPGVTPPLPKGGGGASFLLLWRHLLTGEPPSLLSFDGSTEGFPRLLPSSEVCFPERLAG